METVPFETDLIIIAFGVITTLRQYFHTAVQLASEAPIAIAIDQALWRRWQATAFLAQQFVFAICVGFAWCRWLTVGLTSAGPDRSLPSETTVQAALITTAPAWIQATPLGVPAHLPLTLYVVGVA